MRSPRGFWAAIVFLSMLPMAALYQALFSDGFDSFIHAVLAVGSLLLASAVFDFHKVPRWVNWTACLLIAAEAGIFLLQGVSHLVHSEALTHFAYQVLGQHVEALLVNVFVLWCVAVLLVDSQGKTRILGAVAVSAVACYEIYKYRLLYLGEVPAESLKLLMLLLFVWLLFESRKASRARVTVHPAPLRGPADA